MLNLFNKTKSKGKQITLKLSGLHCAACSLNIDDALEETKGVISSTTNYARQDTVITYDPALVTIEGISQVIESQGYQVVK